MDRGVVQEREPRTVRAATVGATSLVRQHQVRATVPNPFDRAIAGDSNGTRASTNDPSTLVVTLVVIASAGARCEPVN